MDPAAKTNETTGTKTKSSETKTRTGTKSKSAATTNKAKKPKKETDKPKKPIKKKKVEVKKSTFLSPLKPKKINRKTHLNLHTLNTHYPALRIRAEDKPPKRPPNAFAVFYGRYISKLIASKEPDSKINVLETTPQAVAVWKEMSADEKKVYQDESAELRAAYEKKRDEYFKDVDPAVLRAINK